jgi:hypothetical protein
LCCFETCFCAGRHRPVRLLCDLKIAVDGGMQHHLIDRVCADALSGRPETDTQDTIRVTESLFPLYVSEIQADLVRLLFLQSTMA